MLVLVRERRALATPLELGSHESVTPVSRATKSAERMKRQNTFITLYTNMPWLRGTSLFFMFVIKPLWMFSIVLPLAAYPVCQCWPQVFNTNLCDSLQDWCPQSSDKICRCKICVGRLLSLSRWNIQSFRAKGQFVFCH